MWEDDEQLSVVSHLLGILHPGFLHPFPYSIWLTHLDLAFTYRQTSQHPHGKIDSSSKNKAWEKHKYVDTEFARAKVSQILPSQGEHFPESFL